MITVNVRVLREYDAGGHGSGKAGKTQTITKEAYDWLTQYAKGDPGGPIVEIVAAKPPPPADVVKPVSPAVTGSPEEKA